MLLGLKPNVQCLEYCPEFKPPFLVIVFNVDIISLNLPGLFKSMLVRILDSTQTVFH